MFILAVMLNINTKIFEIEISPIEGRLDVFSSMKSTNPYMGWHLYSFLTIVEQLLSTLPRSRGTRHFVAAGPKALG